MEDSIGKRIPDFQSVGVKLKSSCLIILLLFFLPIGSWAGVDVDGVPFLFEGATVSTLNRSAQLDLGGNATIFNVPGGSEPLRIRISGGVGSTTFKGQSGLFIPNQITLPTISVSLGVVDPIVDSLSLSQFLTC
jgi:hypothetical protein